MEIDTKATIQEHSRWIAEKVAEAKEIGIRDGVDGLKVGHVIAMLFKQNEELEAELKCAEAFHAVAVEQRDTANKQLEQVRLLPEKLRKMAANSKHDFESRAFYACANTVQQALNRSDGDG
jgi:NH3-dependent NAD+ synthetase